MKFKTKAVDNIELNVISLIDILLVLLIFFILTTTFTRETQLHVDLPSAGSSSKSVTPKVVEISIDKNGEFYVNAKTVGHDVNVLRQEIITQSENDNTIPFLISGDAESPHKSIVAVLDIASKLGFSRVSISAKQESN